MASQTRPTPMSMRQTLDDPAAWDGRDFASKDDTTVRLRPEHLGEISLEPADVYLINNYTVLHARAAFEDWPELERRRHLLRLWLTSAGFRSLGPGIAKGRQGVAAQAGKTPSYAGAAGQGRIASR
jgi:hypothetical protein